MGVLGVPEILHKLHIETLGMRTLTVFDSDQVSQVLLGSDVPLSETC